MTRTKINRVYMDAKDKNVATVLVFVNDNDELFYDKEFTVAVPEEDIKELYFKGSIFVKNERYYSPYNYDPTNNTIAWKPAESGSGLEEQEQADWNEDDGTKVSYIKNKPEFATVATSGSYNDLNSIPVFANVATSGSYDDLTDKPEFATVASTGNYTDLNGIPALSTIATSGNYNDLSNKPDIPAAQIPADWNQGNHLAPDYIKNKPTIPEAYTLPTASTDTLGGVKVDGTTITIDNNGVISGTDIVQVPADWNQSDTEAVDYIKNKPTIPDAQIPSDWNQSDSTALDYIKNKPSIPAAQVQVDWNQGNHAAIDYIKNKPTIPAAQVPADWEQDDSTALDYIKNKPTIPDAQVPADWEENDSSSPAYILNKPTIPAAPVNPNWNESDSSSLAYIQNKPTIPAAQEQADWNEGNHNSIKYIKNKPTLGTASAKDFTASVTENSADLVTSGAVYSAIDAIPEYTLPTSSTETLGGVKVDGTSITINEGVISSTQYSLPTASNETLGGVKVDGDTITIDNGVISANIPEIPEQEQADWNEDDTTSASYIQNKPNLAGGNTQASGDVITISDGSNLALTSATSTLTPIQDLHGYEYPWVGGAGVNIWDEEWDIGGLNFATGAITGAADRIYSKNLIPVLSNTTYSIRANIGGGIICYYDSNGDFISSFYPISFTPFETFTTPSNCVNMRFCTYSNYGTTYNNDICINISNPTINGTYYPYSNICPISGYDSASYKRCGVNVWDEEWEKGYYNVNTGEKVADNNYIRSKNNIRVMPNTTYYFMCGNIENIAQGVVLFYDKYEGFISSAYPIKNTTFVIPENCYILKFYMYSGYGATYNHDISINYPSTITTYQPYQGQAVTLTFDNTVYSGVTDWISGVVTVDKAMVDLGTLGWGYTNGKFYSGGITDAKKTTGITCQCSQYRAVENISATTVTMANGCVAMQSSPSGLNRVFITDDRFTDDTAFKTAMDGVQLCYELATPTTIQLTATQLTTLAGYNTIYTDVGNISIAYQPNNVIAECKEYTDNAIPTVDSELDDTSLNPIANKPVAEAIADIVGDISDIDSNIEGSKQLTTTGNVITVSDSAATYLEELEVEVEPVQDLHGYDYPWVGGAGKNILPMTVSGIKSANTSGTWSGNVYSLNNATFEILTDNENNVAGIKVNTGTGGASGVVLFQLSNNVFSDYMNENTDYIINGNNATNTNAYLQVVSGISGVVNVGTSLNYTYTSSSAEYSLVVRLDTNRIASDLVLMPMIRLASITDATFAPYSNICPISGYDDVSVTRTGVNVWDEEWESGYYSPANGLKSDNANNIRCKNFIKVSPNMQYYFKKSDVGVILFYDINQTYLGGRSAYMDNNQITTANNIITTPNNCYYITFYVVNSTYSNDISINYPSTITSYQAYQGQTYTVSFVDDQDQSMTVYSGTLDVTTGVLTVDKAMVDLGELTWDYSNSRFNATITGMKSDYTYNSDLSNIICSQYHAKDPLAEWGNMQNGEFGLYNNTIRIKDARYTDAGNFTTAMDGVQLLYELATPQTYNLTPTQVQMLKGYNTVTTDASGGMVIKYQPDNVVGECKEYAQNAVSDGLNSYAPATIFDNKMVLFMGDSFMEGFGQKAADGLDSTSNPIKTPANADASPMRGWAKTFAERYPRANVHNLGIYGATIAYQDNNPSFMGELVYMFNNNWQPDYVVFDGGANDIFQGITSGSATADDTYAVMNWDTFNYNTYQTIPCLEAIFSLFNSNSPTTRLLFIIPPEMSLNVTAEMKTNIDNMQTTIENVCAKWGVSTLRLTEKGSKNTIYSNNTDYYSASDKIHPMQRYYDETINRIISALEAM